MFIYNVDVKEIWINGVEVKSDVPLTKEQVFAKVQDKIIEGDSNSLEYSHTLGEDQWVFQEIKNNGETVFL